MLYDDPIGGTFDLQFEPTHAAAAETRRRARRRLDGAGLPAVVVAELELVIAELLSNAVDQEPEAPVRLEVEVTKDAVHMTVANRARDRGPSDLPPSGPEPTAPAVAGGPHSGSVPERGRGLAIVAALTDDVQFRRDIDRGEEWTTVACLRRLDRADD